jgi:hypothetical protein
LSAFLYCQRFFIVSVSLLSAFLYCQRFFIVKVFLLIDYWHKGKPVPPRWQTRKAGDATPRFVCEAATKTGSNCSLLLHTDRRSRTSCCELVVSDKACASLNSMNVAAEKLSICL